MIIGMILLHNMSAPPRTEVTVRQRLVRSRCFVFSLPSAVPSRDVSAAGNSLRESIFDIGWPEIPAREDVEAAARRLPGFLIGFPESADAPDCMPVRCVALVIALLSRRIDGLFIRSRDPDYSIGALLASSLCVEDWRDRNSAREEQP